MASSRAPLVTVIVPAWNAEATIGETLRSVSRQTYERLEILVVDDGSTDATAELARDYCSREPRAWLIRKENGGVASARNRGIAEARGEWIAPVDADDLWHPTKIEKQVEAALHAPERPGFVYCWFHYIDERSRVAGSSSRWLAQGHVLRQLVQHNFVGTGSTPLVLRSAAVNAGGYDESLRLRGAQGCEDLLLQLLIARRHPVAAVSEHLVGYRVTQGSMSRNAEQMAQSWKLVLQRVQSEDPRVSRALVRRALGMRSLEFAEMHMIAGDRARAWEQLAKALWLDPARCGLQLFYRASRLATRLVRGRRQPPERSPFEATAPTLATRVDPDEIAGLARLLDRFDEKRLTRLARLDSSEAHSASN